MGGDDIFAIYVDCEKALARAEEIAKSATKEGFERYELSVSVHAVEEGERAIVNRFDGDGFSDLFTYGERIFNFVKQVVDRS